jgi:hypothetical protein
MGEKTNAELKQALTDLERRAYERGVRDGEMR